MAKRRYHESYRDEMHEHEGMEKRHRKMYGKDEGMISEDHKAMANLPQSPVMKEYARFPKGINGPIDDTIRRSDEMEYDNLRDIDRYKSKDKY